jgi:predicted amidohydrolase
MSSGPYGTRFPEFCLRACGTVGALFAYEDVAHDAFGVERKTEEDVMKMDILIEGGHVIDPRAKVDGICSVGISGNRVVAVDSGENHAAWRIDATGCYVFPGLIDFHTHLFDGGSGYAYNPEWLLATGVTAAVDPGTCGYANYRIFHDAVVARSSVRIKTFLNVYPGGICDYKVHPHYSLDYFDFELLKELKEKYSETILGLKVMMSAVNVGEHGLAILEKTLEYAERLGEMKVCVHTTDLPCSASEVADRLRPGDIFCHVYSKGGTITDENGKVYDAIKKARTRGVLFDAANGRMHFDFDVAEHALADGFPPDIISTDVISRAFNMGNYVRNLPYMMSKYLALGLDIRTIVKAVTETPASSMNMDGEIGTLLPGARADVTICRIVEKKSEFLDINGSGPLFGKRLIVPVMTLLDGKAAYCQNDFI